MLAVSEQQDVQQEQRLSVVESTVSLPARLEAILYLKGRPMSLKELSGLVDESEADTEQGMLILIAGYAQRDTALEIHESKGYSRSCEQDWGNWFAICCPSISPRQHCGRWRRSR